MRRLCVTAAGVPREPGESCRQALLPCRARATTAASLPLPGGFGPPALSAPRPPGPPKFFVPGAAQAQAGSGGWGQPSIPEAAPQVLEAPAVTAWGAAAHTNGAYAPAEVPAGQDVYTSYADLQPQWPEPQQTAGMQPAPSRGGLIQPGYAAADAQTQWHQGQAQDGELTEIQL